MRSATILAVSAWVMLLFGAGFLLVPGGLFPLYGVEMSPSSLMLARVAGAAVVALGALAWMARGLDFATQRTAHRALAIFFLPKAIVTLLALLSGVFDPIGWSILAIDIPLFAVNAGESFGAPRDSSPPGAP